MHMMQPRRHQRIKHHDQVFVKIVESTDETVVEAEQTFLCSYQDISVKGLRVEVPTEIPVGSEAEIWLRSSDSEGTLRLNGTIVWCRNLGEPPRPHVGIELSESPGAQYKVHQIRIAKKLLPRA